MSVIKLITLAAVIILLTLGSLWVRQQLKIDSCLDNGGRWNYKDDVCELREPVPHSNVSPSPLRSTTGASSTTGTGTSQ